MAPDLKRSIYAVIQGGKNNPIALSTIRQQITEVGGPLHGHTDPDGPIQDAISGLEQAKCIEQVDVAGSPYFRLIWGTGYYCTLGSLIVKVEVQVDGWCYRIVKQKGNEVVKEWTTCLPPGVYGYEIPEGCKFQAISAALAVLNDPSDPHQVLREQGWIPYGSGH